MGQEVKFYVGNLSYDTTNESLTDHLSKAGSVESVNIVIDRDSGRSKGFGFATFAAGTDKDAVLALDNQEFEGRKLRVNIAQDRNSGDRNSGDRRPRSDHGGHGGSSGGFRNKPRYGDNG